MRSRILPTGAWAPALLLMLALTPIGFVLISLYAPALFGVAIGAFAIGAAVLLGRSVRRQLRALRAPPPWPTDLEPLPPASLPGERPPPALPAAPTDTADRCPWDDEPLTAGPDDGGACARCRAEVLSPPRFGHELERLGLSREAVMTLAGLHPSRLLCPRCRRQMASPPLRDARPLVCTACGTAVFAAGDLAVFRGEVLPRRLRPGARERRRPDPLPSTGTFALPLEDERAGSDDGGDSAGSDGD